MNIVGSVKKKAREIENSFMPDKSEDMDILDKLKIEHREVANLLQDLVDSESSAKRKTILKKIKVALVPHVRAEEKIVYDAIIAQKGKEEKIDGEEGYLEHEIADNMLSKLSKISNAMSPEFTAAAKVLKEVIEHHVAEEENNIWKDVHKHFDKDARIEMNRKFENAKKKVRVV